MTELFVWCLNLAKYVCWALKYAVIGAFGNPAAEAVDGRAGMFEVGMDAWHSFLDVLQAGKHPKKVVELENSV